MCISDSWELLCKAFVPLDPHLSDTTTSHYNFGWYFYPLVVNLCINNTTSGRGFVSINCLTYEKKILGPFTKGDYLTFGLVITLADILKTPIIIF